MSRSGRQSDVDAASDFALLASYEHDPLGFVMDAFPWGEKGTPLENHAEGPEEWQRWMLDLARTSSYAENAPVRVAVASGNSVGKSAIVAMLTLWSCMTRKNSRGTVTAGTENQLKTKTQPEIAVWFGMCAFRHLFELTGTRLAPKNPALRDKWRFDLVPWSAQNKEAFSGLHNILGGRVLICIDEASQVPDIIVEAADGVLADKDTQILFVATGNPTRISGWFFEAFPPQGRHRKDWVTRNIDSREVRWCNAKEAERRINRYGGKESAGACSFVLGKFPVDASGTFVDMTKARKAAHENIAVGFEGARYILGVDPGQRRDPFVVYPRRGCDARSVPPVVKHGLEFSQMVELVAKMQRELDAVLVCVDATGIGAQLCQRLRALGINALEVWSAGRAEDENHYMNKRAEIWDRMKDHIDAGGTIVDEVEGRVITLVDELVNVGFGYHGHQLYIEAKEKVKARMGGTSLDVSDALTYTFAFGEAVGYLSGQFSGVMGVHQPKGSWDPWGGVFAGGW